MILSLRKKAIGYVSQFLRAVPRVPAIDVVAETLVANGESREEARARAASLLSSPEHLRTPLAVAAGDLLRR